MFERFTNQARGVVIGAQHEARDLHHNYIGTEHLLLALLRPDSGPPYAVLADAFPRLAFAYRGAYEAVDLVPGLRVHAVPQCAGDEELKAEIAAAAAARSSDHLNLLVTHAAVTVLSRRYTYGDVNELEVDLADLDAGFDRILLGHFHNHAKVAPKPPSMAPPSPLPPLPLLPPSPPVA